MKRYLEHRLKLRMLMAVDAIVEHKSLLKASHMIGVTQPALTRTLRETEEVLGGELFTRHARGMELTPFGEVVWVAARRILADIRRLDRDLDRLLTGEAAQVALGAMAPAVVGILPGLFARLRTSAPNIHVQLTQGREEDLLPLLAVGDLDMVLGRIFQPEQPDEFVREVLYFEPLSVVARAGHPIFDMPDVTASALDHYKIVLPTMSRSVEREIETLLSHLGFPEAIAFRSSSQPFVRELLHTSDHFTISPPMTMAGDLERGTLRQVPIDIPGPPRPAGIIFHRDRPLGATAQAFLHMVRKHVLTGPSGAGDAP